MLDIKAIVGAPALPAEALGERGCRGIKGDIKAA